MLRRAAAFALLLLGTGAAVKLLTEKPSGRRDWSEDVAVPARAELSGGALRLRRVRDFRYDGPRRWTARWYDAEYPLAELESVWFGVEPFGLPGAAHVFLSFCFEGWRCVAVSAEIRKVKGDSFSALRGLLNAYELVYVIADERDLIGLRVSHRRHDVYLYPVRADATARKALLLDMLRRAESLRTRPEFYNTLFNTCATNILRHVNRVAPRKAPWGRKVLLPAYSDRLAYDLGFIDTALPFAQARERFRIGARGEGAKDGPDFSARIRR